MATVDSLEVQISADVEKAHKAISRLVGDVNGLGKAFNSLLVGGGFTRNMGKVAGSFNAIKQATQGVDAGKIQSLSKSIEGLGKSLMTLDKAARTLNMSAAQSQMRALDDIIKNESTKLMEQWGISGQENAKIVQNALKDVVSTYKGVKDGKMTVSGDMFSDATRQIASTVKSIHEVRTEYDKLFEYMRKTNASGQKVFLPFSPDEFPDYTRMRATLGKAFTSDVAHAGATDITSFVQEMNNAIGNWVPMDSRATQVFENLHNVLVRAREDSNRLDEAFRREITTSGQLQSSIAEVVQRITQMNRATNNGFGTGENIAFGGVPLSNFENLSKQLSSLNNIDLSGMGDTTKLTDLANGIAKLGGKKVLEATANLPNLTPQLKTLVTELNGLGTVSFDTTGLTNLATAISRLGSKNATKAAETIPVLKDAIRDLLSELSKMPEVSASTQNTLSALGRIAKYTGGNLGQATGSVKNFSNSSVSNFDRIKKAASGVISAFVKLGSVAGKLTGINKLVNGIRSLAPASNKAEIGFKGLTQKIGKLYASVFVLRGAFGKLRGAITSAMDYVEGYDYFKNAFRQVAENADLSQFKELGYRSAGAYANSFRERAEKVTEQFTGFSVGQYGELTETGSKNLGLNPTQVMETQALFGQMSSSMGVASETAMKLSRVYTKLGADLASVKNMDFADVWDNLSSGMVGMSRAVDKYGINIRNANMQQELTRLGIDANINKLGQQDKALLRTIIILNSTKYAWGNLANTISSPSNQIRLLTSNFQTLAQMLGSIFLPVVSKVLPYINGMVIALKSLVSFIGSLLGVDLSDYMKNVGGGGDNEALSAAYDDAENLSDGLDDAGDSAEKAAKKQKKFNKQLQAFDELNNLTTTETEKNPKSSTSGSDLAGVNADLTAALDDAISQYEAAWKKAFEGMENDANNIAEKIKNAFIKAWKTGSGEEIGKAIAKFVNKGLTWVKKNQKEFNKGLKNIASILGTGLKSFIEDLDWSDLGEIIGNGIKGFLEAETEFFDKMDWTNLGKSLATSLNSAIKTGVLETYFENIASKLRAAIETAFGFVTTFDFDGLGTALGNGINKFFKKMNKVNPETGLNGWQELGVTISKSISGIAQTLAKALQTVDWQVVGQAIVDLISSIDFADMGWNLGKLANALVNSVYQLVSNKEIWSTLGQKIADGLNGFFKGMNEVDAKTGLNGWQALGKSITETITGLSDAITTALDGIDWQVVGQAIADFIGSIDFGKVIWSLGNLVTAFKNAMKETLKGALKISDVTAEVLVDVAIGGWILKKLSKGKLTGAIVSKLKGKVAVLFESVKFSIGSWVAKAKGAVKEKGLITAIKDAIPFLKNGFNLGEIAMKIAKFGVTLGNPDMVADELARKLDEWFTKNIWNKVCDLVPLLDKDSPAGVFQLVPPVFIALNVWKLVTGGFDDIVEKIKEFFNDVSADVDGITSGIDIGNDIGDGILKGMVSALAFPASFVYNLIIKPIMNALGIHSPSKVAKKDIGANIAKGIISGIKDLPKQLKEKIKTAWKKVKDWWKDKAKLPDIVVKLIAEAKEKTKGAIDDLKTKWNSIKDRAASLIATAKEKTDGAIEKLKAAWSSVKDKTVTLVAEAKEKADGVLKSIKEKWEGIKDKTASLVADAQEKTKGVLSNIKGAWDDIASKTSTLTANVQDNASTALSNIQSGWNGIKDGVVTLGVNISAKKDDIKKKLTKLGNELSGNAISLKAKISSKTKDVQDSIETFKKAIGDKALSIKAKIASKKEDAENAFNTLKEGLKGKILSLGVQLASTGQDAKEAVADLIENLKGKIVSLPVELSTKVSEIWNAFKTGASGLWDKTVTLGTGIKANASEIWENFKKNASSLWDKVVSFGAGISLPNVKEIKDALKTKWDKVMNGKTFNVSVAFSFTVAAMKSVVNTAIGWINKYIIDSLNKVSIKIPEINILGKKIFSGKTFGFNISHISTFADGGFPKTGEVYLAREQGSELLGKIGGKNAVANNDQITDAVSDAVYNALNPLMTRMANAIIGLEQSIESNRGTTLSVEGMSEGDIVRIVKNQDTQQRRRTGRGLFAY